MMPKTTKKEDKRRKVYCLHCHFASEPKTIEATGKRVVMCSRDDKEHKQYDTCVNGQPKWHNELYAIYELGPMSKSGKSKHFRLYLNLQVLYVSAGGTSTDITVTEGHYNIIEQKPLKVLMGRKIRRFTQFLQISEYIYKQNYDKTTKTNNFDKFLTLQGVAKLKQESNNTKALTAFFGGD